MFGEKNKDLSDTIFEESNFIIHGSVQYIMCREKNVAKYKEE